MKKYDYDLAKKIVNKLSELDVLESASMGMHEDWFWTAQTIWEEGNWKVDLLPNEEAEAMYCEFEEKKKKGLRFFLDEKDENGLSKLNPEHNKYDSCLFGGIRGSSWATPVIQIELKDGTEKTFNCYIGQSDSDILERVCQSNSWANGCLSGPVQEAREGTKIENFIG